MHLVIRCCALAAVQVFEFIRSFGFQNTYTGASRGPAQGLLILNHCRLHSTQPVACEKAMQD